MQVIIPPNLNPAPTQTELEVAQILSRYFNSDVKFVIRSQHKTPDFLIKKINWELKSPTGGGKHNIQHQFQRAGKQAGHIVLDMRKSKIHTSRAVREIAFRFKKDRTVREIIIVKKDGSIEHLKK